MTIVIMWLRFEQLVVYVNYIVHFYATQGVNYDNL